MWEVVLQILLIYVVARVSALAIVKITPPKTNRIRLGDSVTVECLVTLSKSKFQRYNTKLRWDKADTRLSPQRVQITEGFGSFEIKNTLTISDVGCDDDILTCYVTPNDRTKNGTVTLELYDDPVIPSKLTFQPGHIRVGTRINFTCTGKVGKPARNLELYLKEKGSSARIDLRKVAGGLQARIDEPGKYYCSKIQTIQRSFKVDKAYKNLAVICQIKDDSKYKRTLTVHIDQPETSSLRRKTTTPVPKNNQNKDASSGLAKVFGGIGGAVVAILILFLGVRYLWYRRKKEEEIECGVQEPDEAAIVIEGSRVSLANVASVDITDPTYDPSLRRSEIESRTEDQTSGRRSRRSRRRKRRRVYSDEDMGSNMGSTRRRRSRRSRREFD